MEVSEFGGVLSPVLYLVFFFFPQTIPCELLRFRAVRDVRCRLKSVVCAGNNANITCLENARLQAVISHSDPMTWSPGCLATRTSLKTEMSAQVPRKQSRICRRPALDFQKRKKEKRQRMGSAKGPSCERWTRSQRERGVVWLCAGGRVPLTGRLSRGRTGTGSLG